MTQLQNVRRIGIDARGMQPRSTGLGNYFRNVLVPLAAGNPQVDFYLYSNIGLEAPHAPNIHLRQSAQYQAAPLWMHFSLPKLPQQDGIDIFWGAIGYISTTSSTVSRPRRMTRWNRSVFQTLSGRRADKLVAISSATANDAERIFKRKVNAIVPPAISPAYRLQSDQEVSRVRAQHRIRGEYFLCVGTLEPRKNVKMLLDAYTACRREGAGLPDLLLAGSVSWKHEVGGSDEEPAEQGGQIRYLGYVELQDLPPLYAGAAALLMPSIYEGFGMPVLEAQRCGTPVIHGSHASMVEAGGGLGIAVAPELTAWTDVFEKFRRRELPLVSRLPSDSYVHADSAKLMGKIINACIAEAQR